jgi:hypothetical protein
MVAQDNLLNMQEKNKTVKSKKEMEKWYEFHKSSTHNTSQF